MSERDGISITCSSFLSEKKKKALEGMLELNEKHTSHSCII